MKSLSWNNLKNGRSGKITGDTDAICIASFIKVSEKIRGKDERWLREENFDDETVETATDTRQVDDFYGPVTEYFFPAEYNYTITDISTEYEAKLAKEARLANGKLVRSICDNIMNSIIGFNMEAGKTSEEINQMRTTFSDILSLIQVYQPFQAKPLIQAIVVDAVVTQEMKDEILSFYP